MSTAILAGELVLCLTTPGILLIVAGSHLAPLRAWWRPPLGLFRRPANAIVPGV